MQRVTALYSPRAWIALGLFALVVIVLLPALNLATGPDHPLHVSGYIINLLGKIMCYMMVALAMDLIWGFTGILSLGHGVFFALGRLWHGHVLDAYDRPRGPIPEPFAGLHGVSRLEGISVVLVVYGTFLVRHVARGVGTGNIGFRVRLLRVSLTH